MAKFEKGHRRPSDHSTVVPPKTADLGTDEKVAIFGNRTYKTKKNLICDLKMGRDIGGGR